MFEFLVIIYRYKSECIYCIMVKWCICYWTRVWSCVPIWTSSG